jgi:hypothetical protein
MVGLLPQTNAAAQAEVLGDAWDYRGRPAARSTTGRWGAAAMILVAELNERLTTLGIAVNLVTYLTATMHVGNAEAANVVTNFMGTSFMLCLLGGFVADSFLGRYLTIAIFTAIQASVSTLPTNPFSLSLACFGVRAAARPAAVRVLTALPFPMRSLFSGRLLVIIFFIFGSKVEIINLRPFEKLLFLPKWSTRLNFGCCCEKNGHPNNTV